MELDCAVISSLDALADTRADGADYHDNNAGLENSIKPFGVYLLVWPDGRQKRAVTLLVKTSASSDEELAVMFESPGKGNEKETTKPLSTLEIDIKFHLLAPLMPTARIIGAAERVCKMPDSAFAVKILQRTNVKVPKKILTGHRLNLDGLNPAQANAVTRFMNMQSGVMTIQGPPGIFTCILFV